MGGREGARVVAGVPEQPVVVRGTILARVIDVDVDYVAGELVHHVEPAPVTAACELNERSVDRVVLVVVVRDHRRRTSVERRLVIRPDVPEVPPAVFIDGLTL